MRDLNWSPSEKAAARKAFNLALNRELDALIREARSRVAGVTEASQLWDLEGWLGERRKQIRDRYDYRYSVLPLVLGNLLRGGLITEDDLAGLGQDKLVYIHNVAAL
jgi:hypothetical protein